MTAGSDLDLIVVYDFDPGHPHSDGKRPLYGGQYFARLTQRMISALTVQTNYGVLYPVDMRLRPSGRSGPVATQIEGFKSYQQHEAWTWEHMALTRARVVSGSPDFGAKVEAVIREILCQQRDVAATAGDVVDMRGAIAKEKGDADPWDLKYAAGGLIDIEFIAQYLQLVHAAALPEILDTSTARTLEKAARLGVLAPEDAAVLRMISRKFTGCVCLRVSIRRPRTLAYWDYWRAPPTCRIFQRLLPISQKLSARCARVLLEFWVGRHDERPKFIKRRLRCRGSEPMLWSRLAAAPGPSCLGQAANGYALRRHGVLSVISR